MKVVLFFLLFVGTNAWFMESLPRVLIEDQLTEKVSEILSPLLGKEYGDILGYVVVKVAEVAIVSALEKRELPHNVTAKEVLTNAVDDLEQLLNEYAAELQDFSEQIASLAYLKGDVNQFSTNMQQSKLMYDEKVDNIASSVKQELRCDRREAVGFGNIILSRACVKFTSAVAKLKETFSDVHTQLVEGSNDIVRAVHGRVLLLSKTLAD